jgi:hypothetical protein
MLAVSVTAPPLGGTGIYYYLHIPLTDSKGHTWAQSSSKQVYKTFEVSLVRNHIVIIWV